MTPKKVPPGSPEILGRAMLVNVRLGVWEARKHDKAVTERTNQREAHNPQAGRYHKHLFGGSVESLGMVLTAASNLRLTHYQQTLPWSDSGWRILSTENYFEYTEAMRKAMREYDVVVDAFVAEYPELCRKAKDKLLGMYRKDDYPAAAEVRMKYYADIDFAPLPAGEDFRVTLPKEEMKAMTQSVERRVQESVQTAMTEAWNRLGEAVHDLRSRLDDGKYLRESMIERVREVAEVLGRLNLTDDPMLEKVRKQTLTDLGNLVVEPLKKDDAARAMAAQKADAILKQMSGLYTPPKPAKKGAK